MKLRTRISILTAILAALPTFVLGIIIVNGTKAVFIREIDNSLIATINQPRLLRELRNTAQLPIRGFTDSIISVARYERNGTFTILRAPGFTDKDDFPVLTPEQIFQARTQIITVAGENEFRVFALEPRKNEIFVFAASLEQNQRAVQEILFRTLIAALAIALLSGVIAWFVVSRFFKPVNEMVEVAHKVADGDFSQNMPKVKNGTEIGELTNSINKMLQALRQFVSDASHELRTPLTVIRGYSELLQKPNVDKEQSQRAISRIETESLRMVRLVDDLLTLTKADSVTPIFKRPIKIGQIIEEYFKDIVLQDPSRKIILNLKPETILNCDEDLMRQLFSNLAQNILRHTPQSTGVTVDILQDNQNTTIIIDDQGPGIPESLRNQVFERFTRLDESRSRETGGFGLGMSIIKSVVDKHQAKIYLEESPNKGLRVKLIFPN